MHILPLVPMCLVAAIAAWSMPEATLAQAAAPAAASTVHGTAYELSRQKETESVTVTQIDRKTRFVTLKSEKGDEFTIEASPEVRNFAQLKVGDVVTITYEAATALEILPANGGTLGVESAMDSARSEPGAKPGGVVGKSISVTSRISAIDLAAHTVTLTGPDGKQRRIEVHDPARQARMSSLKVGDLVRMTYVEGVAIQVTPK
ncbi:hypothetical protein [Luteibacter aegosomatissinici]|uniref:hypothetical protein n=1 Tax=Luteibacter aegosomatissinici TaxID=2911539 RepID=UPI001FF76022|nr:hypothetical protein [Luteibacter aegosomatissinici]UPG96540.1 hypothetical protein L2Y97_10615 [Luteibacter aegosomatissinici]